MTNQRKVIQLTAVFIKEGSYANYDGIQYVALCNDGSMWVKDEQALQWTQLAEVPQPSPEGEKK